VEYLSISAPPSRGTLCRRALPFLAPVHQHDALTKRFLEYDLVFVSFDLQADRLKTYFVFRHVSTFLTVLLGRAGKEQPLCSFPKTP